MEPLKIIDGGAVQAGDVDALMRDLGRAARNAQRLLAVADPEAMTRAGRRAAGGVRQ